MVKLETYFSSTSSKTLVDPGPNFGGGGGGCKHWGFGIHPPENFE